MFEAEPGEEDGLECIDADNSGHDADEFGMLFIMQCGGDCSGKAEAAQHEQQGDRTHRRQCGGEDPFRLFLLLVGKIEEGGFHAEGQQH